MVASVTLFRMNELHQNVRSWLRGVLSETNLSATALAAGIGVSTTTLTRVLNDASVKHTLSMSTIDKISRYTGISATPIADGRSIALSPEQEVQALPGDASYGDVRVDEAVRYLCQAEPGLSPWKLNTRALEVAGYLPGDIVIVDLNAAAEDGDIVVAQIYAEKTETVFRLYNKPYLIAAAHDRVPRKPLLVDDDQVLIKGVVIATFRPRRGHLIAA